MAFANHKWLSLYPTPILDHLTIIGSDQAPILLNLHPTSHQFKHSSFEFKAKWLRNVDLYELVKNAWSLFVKGSSAYH